MDDATTKVVMGLIMQGGNAKGAAVEAIQAAKAGDMDLAQAKFKDADAALVEAHNVQTDLLTKEAQGDPTPVNLYLVHAQDWLMNGLTFVDLAKEIVVLYAKLQ